MPTNWMDSSITSLSCLPKRPQNPVYGLRPMPTSSSTVMLRNSHFSVSTTPMSVASSLSEYVDNGFPLNMISPSSGA